MSYYPERLVKWVRGRTQDSRELGFKVRESIPKKHGGSKGEARDESKVGASDNDNNGGIECWKCGHHGHIARQCKTPRRLWKARDNDAKSDNGKDIDKDSGNKSVAKCDKTEKSRDTKEKVHKCIMNTELDMTLVEETYVTKLRLDHQKRMGVKANEVDFILDTATESGIGGS